MECALATGQEVWGKYSQWEKVSGYVRFWEVLAMRGTEDASAVRYGIKGCNSQAGATSSDLPFIPILDTFPGAPHQARMMDLAFWMDYKLAIMLNLDWLKDPLIPSATPPTWAYFLPRIFFFSITSRNESL